MANVFGKKDEMYKDDKDEKKKVRRLEIDLSWLMQEFIIIQI